MVKEESNFLRILVGSIQQETNSFSPVVPALEEFDYLEGEEMLSQIAVTELFREAGAEVIPTIYANAVPSGRFRKTDYEELCNRLLSRIPALVDGVWLYCHGAMEVEEFGSGELYLAKCIRKRLGNQIPITMALDFHANIHPDLLRYVNVICGYRTAPHRDMDETQRRAARHLITCIKEKLLPAPVLVRIPMMLAGDMVITDQSPMAEVMQMALDTETDPEILDTSVFNGQNWVDIPHAGASVVVNATANREKAGGYAARIARKYWDSRTLFEFRGEAHDPRRAVDLAMNHTGKRPLFLSDSGDNTTAGAAGDNSELLQLLIEKGATNTAVVGLADAAAVEFFSRKSPGETATIQVGGSLSPGSVRTTITAALLRNGNILGWDGFGAGRMAVVRIKQNGTEIDLVLTENRTSVTNRRILESVGISSDCYQIIAVKLGYLYPDLEALAARHIIAFTNGSSCIKIKQMPYKNIPRPMYPFDTEFCWSID